MKPCLADINVLVACWPGNHDHHALARKWFAGCGRAKLAFAVTCSWELSDCLTNPGVMKNSAISGFAAFRIMHELIDLDERVEFVADHADTDVYFPQYLSQSCAR